MKNKLILTIGTACLAVVGTTAMVSGSGTLTAVYVGVSAALLGAVAVGGAINYNNQDNQDIRDVWREKIRMLNNKLLNLEELSIEQQKLIISLENQIEKRTTAGGGAESLEESVPELFSESAVVSYVTHK